MYKFIPKVDLRSCEFLNFRSAVLSQPCPHCHNTGALKAHGSIRSSHPDRSSPDARRAVRFYCSNRHGRTGCGRTFSIHFDHIIPRCSLDTLRVTTLIESFCCTLGATGITDALRKENRIPLGRYPTPGTMMKMDSNYDISVEKRPKSPDVNLSIGYDINSARNT